MAAFKFTSLAFVTLLAVACARANYASVQNMAPMASQVNPTCPLRFPTAGLCANFQWTQMPTDTQPGSLSVKMWSASDSFFPPKLVTPSHSLVVILWMESMNHGSLPTEVQLVGPGRYSVRNVFFNMHGPWQLQFHLQDGEVVFDSSDFSLHY